MGTIAGRGNHMYNICKTRMSSVCVSGSRRPGGDGRRGRVRRWDGKVGAV